MGFRVTGTKYNVVDDMVVTDGEIVVMESMEREMRKKTLLVSSLCYWNKKSDYYSNVIPVNKTYVTTFLDA
jgi:hypothetical protein